jgi:hypothetical protein
VTSLANEVIFARLTPGHPQPEAGLSLLYRRY